MIPTNISLDGQNLTLLEAQLMEGDTQRPAFVEAAESLRRTVRNGDDRS
jgi:hypothetical protein